MRGHTGALPTPERIRDNGRAARLLVVEADDAKRDWLRTQLERAGWKVHATETTHDAFDDAAFARHVTGLAPSALVLSGVETDVCVLATAMSAVDLGYRTVIAVDAVTSSVTESHQACLDHVYPRYDQQIELASVDQIISGWSES